MHRLEERKNSAVCIAHRHLWFPSERSGAACVIGLIFRAMFLVVVDNVEDVFFLVEVVFKVAEVVSGRDHLDAFPPLRPLTTLDHVSHSDVSVPLDVCPGNSLGSDSSF